MNELKEYKQGSVSRGVFIFIFALVITGGLMYFLYASVPTIQDSQSEFVEDTTPIVDVTLPDTEPILEEADILEDEDVVVVEEVLEEDLEIETITNDELANYIIKTIEGTSDEEKVIYDLRDESDYIEGHIRYSKHYDISTFVASDFISKASYVLVCEEDSECKEAKKILQKVGTNKIVVLENGFNSWSEEGYRVIRKGETDDVDIITTESPEEEEEEDAEATEEEGISVEEVLGE